MLANLKLVEWPWSQVCMDCSFGQFVEVEGSSSCYLCHWEKSAGIMNIPTDCPESIPTVFDHKIEARHGQHS